MNHIFNNIDGPLAHIYKFLSIEELYGINGLRNINITTRKYLHCILHTFEKHRILNITKFVDSLPSLLIRCLFIIDTLNNTKLRKCKIFTKQIIYKFIFGIYYSACNYRLRIEMDDRNENKLYDDFISKNHLDYDKRYCWLPIHNNLICSIISKLNISDNKILVKIYPFAIFINAKDFIEKYQKMYIQYAINDNIMVGHICSFIIKKNKQKICYLLDRYEHTLNDENIKHILIFMSIYGLYNLICKLEPAMKSYRILSKYYINYDILVNDIDFLRYIAYESKHEIYPRIIFILRIVVKSISINKIFAFKVVFNEFLKLIERYSKFEIMNHFWINIIQYIFKLNRIDFIEFILETKLEKYINPSQLYKWAVENGKIKYIKRYVKYSEEQPKYINLSKYSKFPIPVKRQTIAKINKINFLIFK